MENNESRRTLIAAENQETADHSKLRNIGPEIAKQTYKEIYFDVRDINRQEQSR